MWQSEFKSTRVISVADDGFYYPGIIAGTKQTAEEEIYIIKFDNDRRIVEKRKKDIFGPDGFHPISEIPINVGQPVYLYNTEGKHVKGTILKHLSEELLAIKSINDVGETNYFERKIDDISVAPPEIAKLHMETVTGKSNAMDVPVSLVGKTRKRRSEDDDNERLLVADNNNDDEDGGSDVMDEVTAAMVLTSLSCSPMTPDWSLSPGSYPGASPSPPTPTHRLPSITSRPLPVGGGRKSLKFSPISSDEGIVTDVDSDHSSLQQPTHVSLLPARKKSKELMYQCTWPQCGIYMSSEDSIIQHIRHLHLGPRPDDENDDDDDGDDYSDHEEEFYYEEVEVHRVSSSPSPASAPNSTSLSSASAPASTFLSPDSAHPHTAPTSLLHPPQVAPVPHEDHEYTRRAAASLLSQSSHSYTVNGQSNPLKYLRANSWQQPSYTSCGPSITVVSNITKPPTGVLIGFSSSPKSLSSSPNTLSFMGTSPKTSPMKKRGDTRKCRKVYGMENREMWCTQCRWKKACTRFVE